MLDILNAFNNTLHKNLKTPLALSLSLCALPFSLQAAYWSPHIGADYKYWGLEPNVYYEDTFPRIKNTLNLYIGTRINAFFGVDIGYEISQQPSVTHVFEGGEVFLRSISNASGTTTPTTLFTTPELLGNNSQVSLRLRAPHIDFNFYWEIAHRFEILFMAGVAFVNPATHIFHYTVGDVSWFEYESSSETKTMGRIGIGAQFNPCPRIGIKALFSWDPDIRLKYDVTTSADQVISNVTPYKTSTGFNIGVVYSFSNPRRGLPRKVYNSHEWFDSD